jgi:hypothetical protein
MNYDHFQVIMRDARKIALSCHRYCFHPASRSNRGMSHKHPGRQEDGFSPWIAAPGAVGAMFLGYIAIRLEVHAMWMPLAASIVIIATFAIMLINRQQARRRLAQAAEDPGQVLRDRISQVDAAFTEAASLMDDLRRDLEVQQATRDALVAQAEEQQRLLEVDQEQAERIRQILVGETKATIRAERRQQWMFFALGVATSIPIGIMINLLVP